MYIAIYAKGLFFGDIGIYILYYFIQIYAFV